ncbi:MAG: hypothetical protein Q9227_006044 [Pyrenula ochraceoflavens]
MSGRGRNNEELFLNQDAGRRSPTIEPLRISKRDSTASPSPSVGSQHSASNVAAQNTAPYSTLPYPDDRLRQPSRPSNATPYQYPAPYPDAGRRTTPDPGRQSPNVKASSPANSIGSAGSGVQYPSAVPPSLRVHDGREAKQPSNLAERRGNAPKPLPDSPGPETPDKEGLFQRAPQRGPTPQGGTDGPMQQPPQSTYQQQYWPPPDGAASSRPSNLRVTSPTSINRISSTASTSTTKAQRGSPPPPETPILPAEHRQPSDIEARYAAAGIAGTATLNSLQAQNAAAQQRAQNYGSKNKSGQTGSPAPARPWTPTEPPGSQPSTVYQGPGAASDPAPAPMPQTGQVPPPSATTRLPPHNALENDMQRLNVHEEPPPAYSQVSGGQAGQSYPAEKGRMAATPAAAPTAATPQASSTLHPNNQQHPAFANDPRSQQPSSSAQQPVNGATSPAPSAASQQTAQVAQTPASPPPLPEGWIAHLDPNSGQYYYIHLATQSTQWEFPKGPTPLNLNDHAPLSPVGSTYNNPLASPAAMSFSKPMASPGVPLTPGFDTMSIASGMSNPAAFTGPPPSSGVELYKVQATNGVYFGPYLRYTNMDIERGLWLGSILLVTDAPQPPTIHIHQSVDLSPNPRQLKGINIHRHQRWTFYKYEIDLRMEDSGSAKWTYAITSHLGCTRYEFVVAGRHETNWRFVATSGNDFTLNVSANERQRIGGVGFMWKDIMQKHAESGGFHAQLGLGGQIYADRLWKEVPSLKQWLATSGKEARKNAVWTTAHEEDISHAYFHYYTSHFDQPHLREAFAQIPYILTLDDHDIFDGFGSYPDYMQFSNMFKNIGRIGIEMYLLFQHHTTLEILRDISSDMDLFTITGTGWHFVKFLGPAVAVVGPDCRSERNPHQVMAGPTYQGIFPKIAMLPSSVQHCLLMIPVPVIYPRLEAAESIAHTVATGKKAVTGAYNLMGKVTSSVAGVVGAKGAVGSGFDSVKRAVGKSGLMGGILSPFGDIDVLDELRDQWTHDSKDLERTYLIRTLQGIAHQRSIRMSFVSGSVNCCGAGLVHDPSHPSDHKTMYQLISSAVVNTPPPSYVLKLLANNKPLYIPQNGHRSAPGQPTDTKEDMLDVFGQDVTGVAREGGARKLMGRRNYVAIIAYDPEAVQGTYGRTDMHGNQGAKVSLAADFMVQPEGGYATAVKFGPVIVPSLEFGR